ncbi:hypothetical protein PRZ48_011179 [Zasmidium cellare]|uniref:Uncharacterized protein n=1 Tax=Zasmidium cellare TaxID=395010 RepID=A0ABR0EB83_ZASCE|nr:hypothetical protein PRZ48_011179 [Zasmidium cellare]
MDCLRRCFQTLNPFRRRSIDSTPQDNSTPQDHDTRRKHFPFLELPPELRVIVYQELLVRDRTSKDHPRYPQILSVSKQIYKEALAEMQNNGEVLINVRSRILGRGWTRDDVVGTVLGVEAWLYFENYNLADRGYNLLSAYHVSRLLPPGLHHMRRIRLCLQVGEQGDSDWFAAGSVGTQVRNVLAGLATALNHTARIEIDVESTQLEETGWTRTEIDSLLRPLSRVRPLRRRTTPGRSSHFFDEARYSYDSYLEVPLLIERFERLAELMEQAGIKLDGLRFLQRPFDAVYDKLITPDRGAYPYEGMKTPRIDFLERLMAAPLLEKLQKQAEQVLARDAARRELDQTKRLPTSTQPMKGFRFMSAPTVQEDRLNMSDQTEP